MTTRQAPRTLEDMAAEEREASQIALVREHWSSVQSLWLDGSDLDPAGHIRSELPDDFFVGCGMPGSGTIRPTNDGQFEFAEDGQPAVIIAAYDTVPGILGTNPERHIEHLIDLVAVEADCPSRIWLRRGEALVLGSAYLDLAGQEDAPLPVFRSPLSWLKSGGNGIVALDWNWVPSLLLGLNLIAEDVDLGNRLEAALRPDIWVRETAA